MKKTRCFLLFVVCVTAFVGHSFAAESGCEEKAAAYAHVASVAMESQCAGASDSEVLAAAKAASADQKVRLTEDEVIEAAGTLTANIKSGDRSLCDAAGQAAKALEVITKAKVSLSFAVVDQVEQHIFQWLCGSPEDVDQLRRK